MSRISGILLGAALLSTAIGCTKKDPEDRTDSSAASAAASAAPVFDKAVSIAAIHASNDLWLRSVKSRNLDSLVSIYASDAVSKSEGAPAAKGADAIRTAYAAFFKANPRVSNSTSTMQSSLMMERWVGMRAPSLEPSTGPEESQ